MIPAAPATLAASILEIQRLSTEDGPGLRSTVFFKGCSLACLWCHNPESIARAPQIQWVGSRCLGCGRCLAACRQGALSQTTNGIAIARERCLGCGDCAEACPATAMELLGYRVGLNELVRDVLKDKAYFLRSKQGGVTASGGEAALQADFVAAFFAALSAAGLHTALDTCGEVPAEHLRRILPHTDLVLYDLKLADAAAHKHYTGHGTTRIRENFALVLEATGRAARPLELWVRTPIIPGYTDTETNLLELGRRLAPHAGQIARWELCAFNNLCRDKYRRLGLDWALKDAPLLSASRMDALRQAALAGGFTADKLRVSGACREEESTAAAPSPPRC